MVDVQTEIYIGVPRAIVAAFAAEPGNAPHWYSNIALARWLSEPPLRVGSRMAFSARFLGRTLDYSYDVVEFVPGERLVMQTSQGPFPVRTSYNWSDVGNGTHMTLRNDGQPRGFSVVAGVLMAPMMRRAMRKDLAKIKEILEAAA
ncbi:SRPBCC family protein [Arthrobacter psychrolactophilus]